MFLNVMDCSWINFHLARPIGWDFDDTSSTDEINHHGGDEGNSSGNDEGGGGQGTRGGQDKEQDSGREGNHGVEESKSFEPEDLPHNKRRRDSQEKEMPKSCCQNDG